MVIRTNHYKLLTFNKEFCQWSKKYEWEECSCVMNHQWHPAVKKSYWDIIRRADIGKFYSSWRARHWKNIISCFLAVVWKHRYNFQQRKGNYMKVSRRFGRTLFCVIQPRKKRGQSGIWFFSANISGVGGRRRSTREWKKTSIWAKEQGLPGKTMIN